jgi:hypothetical protein
MSPPFSLDYAGPTLQQLQLLFTQIPTHKYCQQLRLFCELNHLNRHVTPLSPCHVLNPIQARNSEEAPIL